MLVLRYEDLICDTAGAFRRALDFVGRPASDHDISRAVGNASFAELQRQERERGFTETPRETAGRFFRRGESGAWRDELTPDPDISQRIESAHGEMMLRLGYRPRWVRPGLSAQG